MKKWNTILTYLIASVWLINGLFCKTFNLVPRHQLIVARMLGDEHARTLTIIIGVLETGMAIWVISGIKRQLNAIIQMLLIAVMNILEFFLVPDLLLWGRLNALFALLFILVIYCNAIYLAKRTRQTTRHAYFFKKSSISGRGLF